MDLIALAHAIADDGITAHEADLLELAAGAGAELPTPWAAVLDRTLPAVVRERLFGRLERVAPNTVIDLLRAA
jgi:hypothetical protein